MRLLRAVSCAAVGSTIVAMLSSLGGCSDTAQVRQVFMALETPSLPQQSHIRTVFYDDVLGPSGQGGAGAGLYCIVDWSGTDPDSTLDVYFKQTQGELALFDGSNVLVPVARQWLFFEDFPSAGAVTLLPFEFQSITDTQTGIQLPIPVGDWECDVFVNGVEAGSTPFTVIYPPKPECPIGTVESTGNPCTAYPLAFDPQLRCPSAANYNDPTACQCEVPDGGTPPDRTWVCQ